MSTHEKHGWTLHAVFTMCIFRATPEFNPLAIPLTPHLHSSVPSFQCSPCFSAIPLILLLEKVYEQMGNHSQRCFLTLWNCPCLQSTFVFLLSFSVSRTCLFPLYLFLSFFLFFLHICKCLSKKQNKNNDFCTVRGLAK